MISNYYLWTIKIYNSWAVRFGFGFETRSLSTIIWIVDANNTREHNKQKNRNIVHLLIHVTTCIMDCSVDTVCVPIFLCRAGFRRKSVRACAATRDSIYTFKEEQNRKSPVHFGWSFRSISQQLKLSQKQSSYTDYRIFLYFYWFIDRWCGKVNKYNSSSTKNHFVEKEIEHLTVYCIATFFTLLLLLWRCERYFYGDWSLCFVLLFGVISFVIDASQQNTNYRLCQRRWNSH